MGNAVRKTISLPPDLAREIEKEAAKDGKTLSAVIQDALRDFIRRRKARKLLALEGHVDLADP